MVLLAVSLGDLLHVEGAALPVRDVPAPLQRQVRPVGADTDVEVCAVPAALGQAPLGAGGPAAGVDVALDVLHLLGGAHDADLADARLELPRRGQVDDDREIDQGHGGHDGEGQAHAEGGADGALLPRHHCVLRRGLSRHLARTLLYIYYTYDFYDFLMSLFSHPTFCLLLS